MSKDRFFKRYHYIINTIKRKRINASNLAQDILENMDDLHSYSTRTLSRDIREIQSIFGIDILFDRKSGNYIIKNDEVLDEDMEKQKMLEAFQFVELAKIAKDYNDIILFEQRKLVGFEFIPTILEAIKNLNLITFEYVKFDDLSNTKRIVKPLALREHNSRWYLMAEEWNSKEKIIKTFGLDRIQDLEILNDSFIYPDNFNVKNHFQNIFGVGVGLSNTIEKIQLEFDLVSAKYVETLPIHHSQKEIKRTANSVVYQFELFINQELVREIIKIGKGVKVLIPNSLKQEVIRTLNETLNHYK